MKIYSEKGSSSNKPRALKKVARSFPYSSLHLLPLVKEDASKPFITKEVIIAEAARKCRLLTIEHTIPLGSVIIILQKGWNVSKQGEAFLGIAAVGFVTGITTPPTVEYSEIATNVSGLGSCIARGMHPYEAYEAITGINIRNKDVPVYEIITKNIVSELSWMHSVITPVLTALSKQKSDSLL